MQGEFGMASGLISVERRDAERIQHGRRPGFNRKARRRAAPGQPAARTIELERRRLGQSN